jgi:hypothetical protein
VRKIDVEKKIAGLKQEQASLQDHLDMAIITDAQADAIEAISTEIEVGLDHTIFEGKRRYIELLDIRCIIALEDGKETVYAKCKLVKQQLLQMQTWPSSSIGASETAR